MNTCQCNSMYIYIYMQLHFFLFFLIFLDRWPWTERASASLQRLSQQASNVSLTRLRGRLKKSPRVFDGRLQYSSERLNPAPTRLNKHGRENRYEITAKWDTVVATSATRVREIPLRFHNGRSPACQFWSKFQQQLTGWWSERLWNRRRPKLAKRVWERFSWLDFLSWLIAAYEVSQGKKPLPILNGTVALSKDLQAQWRKRELTEWAGTCRNRMVDKQLCLERMDLFNRAISYNTFARKCAASLCKGFFEFPKTVFTHLITQQSICWQVQIWAACLLDTNITSWLQTT